MTVIERRKILAAAVATVPLAALLKDARLARAAAETLEPVSITTAQGRSVTAALARPEAASAPAVVLIHEWWGLNDQIKSMAAELAKEGYLALAVDLYQGAVASDAETAKQLVGAVKPEEASDTLAAWIAWLRTQPGSNGKVATLGWCFGGGWSLNASLASPTEACVIYYGRVNKTAAELAPLAAPVLGHFGTKDQFINPEMVEGFLAAAKEAGKQVEAYSYEADHAFANPTSASYDAPDAALAWERTLAFLQAKLA